MSPSARAEAGEFEGPCHACGAAQRGAGFIATGLRVVEAARVVQGQGLKDGIMLKAVRGKALTPGCCGSIKLVSKTRYIVEHGFGGQKRWFGTGVARYAGLARTREACL